MMSVCLYDVCACLDVNQGGTHRNRCTQRLVILRAQTYWSHTKSRSVWPTLSFKIACREKWAWISILSQLSLTAHGMLVIILKSFFVLISCYSLGFRVLDCVPLHLNHNQGFIYTPKRGVHRLFYEHTPIAMTPWGSYPILLGVTE